VLQKAIRLWQTIRGRRETPLRMARPQAALAPPLKT
jgi:hypothetical protein